MPGMTLSRACCCSSSLAKASHRCHEEESRRGGQAQSRESSIFLLTSIFNNSIHSSIAVFHLEPQIHEKWKGRIATWQPRKRAARKRAARKSSSSLAQKQTGDAKASPSFVYVASLQKLSSFAFAMILLRLRQAARRGSGRAADLRKRNVAPLQNRRSGFARAISLLRLLQAARRDSGRA